MSPTWPRAFQWFLAFVMLTGSAPTPAGKNTVPSSPATTFQSMGLSAGLTMFGNHAFARKPEIAILKRIEWMEMAGLPGWRLPVWITFNGDSDPTHGGSADDDVFAGLRFRMNPALLRPTRDLRSSIRKAIKVADIDTWIAERIRLERASDAELAREFAALATAKPGEFYISSSHIPSLHDWLRRADDIEVTVTSIQTELTFMPQFKGSVYEGEDAPVLRRAALLAEVFDRWQRRDAPPRHAARRILIVDDEINFREKHRQILSKLADTPDLASADIEEAADGFPAFVLYREAIAMGHPFDLVLTDGMMDVTNGFEFAGMIRAFERAQGRAAVPIVLISRAPHYVMAAKAGIEYVVEKDYAATLLPETLRTLRTQL